MSKHSQLDQGLYPNLYSCSHVPPYPLQMAPRMYLLRPVNYLTPMKFSTPFPREMLCALLKNWYVPGLWGKADIGQLSLPGNSFLLPLVAFYLIEGPGGGDREKQREMGREGETKTETERVCM